MEERRMQPLVAALITTFLLAVAGWLVACSGEPTPSPTQGQSPTPSVETPTAPTVIPNGRFHYVQGFYSPQLGNSRDLMIYLPASYESRTDLRYPVLYMHDGQNLFNDDLAAFGFAWHVDAVADALVASGRMREIIIVGVYNTSARISEYTPTEDPYYGGGDGPLYLDFLSQTVKPWVDSHYRTMTAPNNTALMGSSLGGLISFWAATEWSDTFGMVGAMSPSFWWNGQDTLALVQKWTELPADVRFYIDVGTAEGDDSDADGITSMVEDAREVSDLLLARGGEWLLDVGYLEVIGAPHNEIAWGERVEHPLRLFFGDNNPPGLELSLEAYGGQVGLSGVTRLPTTLQVHYASGLHLTLPAGMARWSSEPAGIVGIEADGSLVGISVGVAHVTAEYDGVSAGADVEVVESLSSDVLLTFEVTVPPPPEGSAQTTVYIVGDHEALGSWDPAAVPMTQKGAQVWEKTLSFPRGTYLQYKYTRGSWSTVEKGSSHQEVPNRSAEADSPRTLTDVVETWSDG